MDRKVWKDYTLKTKRRELTQMWIRQHTAVLDECAQLLSESEAAAYQHALLSAEVLPPTTSAFSTSKHNMLHIKNASGSLLCPGSGN